MKQLCDCCDEYSLLQLSRCWLGAHHSLRMAMSTHHMSDSPPLVITPSIAEPRWHWSDNDELALINFLLDHIAEVVDGGSFKLKIWNTAAV